jgi:hypothetical protein
MRLTDFRQRLAETFGPAYSTSVVSDQVIQQLGGRTIERALADGDDVHAVWRAVCAAYPDRVPARLR